jgi:hypothetical protein
MYFYSNLNTLPINSAFRFPFTPFHFPPRGKGFVTPSPLGEVPMAIGREGGKKT